MLKMEREKFHPKSRVHSHLKYRPGKVRKFIENKKKSDDSTPSKKSKKIPSQLIMTPSFTGYVSNLTRALDISCPVLIEGPVGCGKTSLVEHVAAVKNKKLIRVQISDQTDAKSLLGTYCCSEVPGQFIWRDGPLTSALLASDWLLLEDLDRAQPDLITLLAPLLEGQGGSSAGLQHPSSGGMMYAGPGFGLIATRRLLIGSSGDLQPANGGPGLGWEKRWTPLLMTGIDDEEMQQIMLERFPSLSILVPRLLELNSLLSSPTSLSLALHTSAHMLTSSQSTRLFSSRDLLKLCTRYEATELMAEQATGAGSQNAFLDALDCFVVSMGDLEQRLILAERVAALFNISKSGAMEVLIDRRPEIRAIGTNKLQIGRATLPRKQIVSLQVDNALSQPQLAETRSSLSLLERLAVCVRHEESPLLVGETGCGKTSCVQFLAKSTGHRLRVVNMNQQSDSADLLGGYKPVELRYLVRPVKEEFETLFDLNFNQDGSNIKFLQHIQTCFQKCRWKDLLALMRHPIRIALERFKSKASTDYNEWLGLSSRLQQLTNQVSAGESALAFSFVEGVLVSCLRQGDWLLLDEINLAPPEMFHSLAGLLESATGSVLVTERGDSVPVPRNSHFRLFACMNPATDVGKRDLPSGLRNRFTEIFVEEPTAPVQGDKAPSPLVSRGEEDLCTLVRHYLRGLGPSGDLVRSIVRFYAAVKQAAKETLEDGCGQRPHFSLRTLCRALSEAARNAHGTTQRSLYEGFCFGFLSQLCRSSRPQVERLILHHILAGKPLTSRGVKVTCPQGHVMIEGYALPLGSRKPIISEEEQGGYILTESVRSNLKDLSRVVAAGSLPVLLQGETSVGKTSLIHYLARLVGQVCLRVNNHEHTDLQEYIGCYSTSTDTGGRLVFREGVLVEAMRKGYWVILDELNLAPTDILEALNRVLDDNRELFIPETQEVVKAHPKFMLFATQNPPGLYGGRKVLSRALRNRFIELHFDPIPNSELEVILEKRCSIPPSRAKKLVEVLHTLQTMRKESGVFQGKEGFITLRDLFRWAERYRRADQSWSSSTSTSKFFDWDQFLADEGYLLVAGRVRRPAEARTVAMVLEKVFRRKVDESSLFDLSPKTSPATLLILQRLVGESVPDFDHIVWTHDLRRLAVLVAKALEFEEPVLLVGETGCGKTTVCQLLARLRERPLHTLNCHLHTEAADFLGGLRPLRHPGGDSDVAMDTEDSNQCLFEWVDGPLVVAMTHGDVILIDEISLADDSVLERLNSVLEPERRLLLAEKGFDVINDCPSIVAQPEFRLVATMNPGTDFGKKELSPALRNRFTEIWCPATEGEDDLKAIVEHNLKLAASDTPVTTGIASAMVDFMRWFGACESRTRCQPTIRDLLSWVTFVNTTAGSSAEQPVPPGLAYIHGAFLVFIDAFSADGATSYDQGGSIELRNLCVTKVIEQMNSFLSLDYTDAVGQVVVTMPIDSNKAKTTPRQFVLTSDYFGVTPFYIKLGKTAPASLPASFSLAASTPASNCSRVLRGLQLNKPVLLEGSPGVGKSSLVTAMAQSAGHKLLRVNLSEQTDVSDLFGCDLPVEGGRKGEFSWRDGPLLTALKKGHWILLDEMNLASQAVLESLNACLDHRGEVFLPELNITFRLKSGVTRIFACQNPMREGGGRKGLPRSFLNRFTQVYLDPLTTVDQLIILSSRFKHITLNVLQDMIKFNEKLHQTVMIEHDFGHRGSPWEFNLRDLTRWCQLLEKMQVNKSINPAEFLDIMYVNRMRTKEDKEKVVELWTTLNPHYPLNESSGQVFVTTNHITAGRFTLPRTSNSLSANQNSAAQWLHLLHGNRRILEALIANVNMAWMTILVGPSSVGKSSAVQLLAMLSGRPLHTLPLHSGMDTTELLGSFEQCSEGGRFVWRDSLLVDAVRHGHWILLDNVNFCSASVLDRLNGLLEPGGELVLTERGLVEGDLAAITPHPDFRIFLAMNPDCGHGAAEISRAMRNRGVEVAVFADQSWPLQLSPSDVSYLLQSEGIDPLSCHQLISLLQSLTEASSTVAGSCHAELSWLLTAGRMLGVLGDENREEKRREVIGRTFLHRQYNKESRQRINDFVTLKLSGSTDSDFIPPSAGRMIQSCRQLMENPSQSRVDEEWNMILHLLSGEEVDPTHLHTLARIFCGPSTHIDAAFRREKFRTINDCLIQPFGLSLMDLMQASTNSSDELNNDLPIDRRWLFSFAENDSKMISNDANLILLRFHECFFRYQLKSSSDISNVASKKISRKSINKLMPSILLQLTDSGKIPESWTLEYPHLGALMALVTKVLTALETGSITVETNDLFAATTQLYNFFQFACNPVGTPQFWANHCVAQLDWLTKKFVNFHVTAPSVNQIGRSLKKLSLALHKLLDLHIPLPGLSIKRLRAKFPTPLPWSLADQSELMSLLWTVIGRLSLWSETVSETLSRQIIKQLIGGDDLVQFFADIVRILLKDSDKEIDLQEFVLRVQSWNQQSSNAHVPSAVPCHLWPTRVVATARVAKALPIFINNTTSRDQPQPIVAALVRQLTNGKLPDFWRLGWATHRLSEGTRSFIGWLTARDRAFYAALQSPLLEGLCAVGFECGGSLVIKEGSLQDSWQRSLTSQVTSLTDAVLRYLVPLSSSNKCKAISLRDFEEEKLQLTQLHKLLVAMTPLATCSQFDEQLSEARVLEELICLQLHAIINSLTTLENLKSMDSIAETMTLKQLTHHLKSDENLFKRVVTVLPCLTGMLNHVIRCDGDLCDLDLDSLGECTVLWGCAQMQLFALTDSVDPQEIITVKLEQAQQELIRLEKEFDFRNQISLAITGVPITIENARCQHPYLSQLLSRTHWCREKIAKLQQKVAYRPATERFSYIRGLTTQFLRSYGPSCLLSKNQLTVSKELLSNHQAIDRWCIAGDSLLSSMTSYEPAYQDVIGPFAAGVTRVMAGFGLIMRSISTKNKKSVGIHGLLRLLCMFPRSPRHPHTSHSSLLELANQLVSEATAKDIWIITPHKTERMRIDLYKLALRILTCLDKSSAGSQSGHVLVWQVANQLAVIWLAEAEKRRQAEEAKSRLLIERSRRLETVATANKDESDGGDESADWEMVEMRWRMQKFAKVWSTGEDDAGLLQDEERDKVNVFDDMNSLHAATVDCIQLSLSENEVHFFVTVLARLFSSPQSNCDHVNKTRLEVQVECLRIAGCLLQESKRVLDPSIDRELLPCLLAMTSHLSTSARAGILFNSSEDLSLSSMDQSRPFDIYKDPSTEEVTLCKPALANLKVKAAALMEEWPDNPTLIQISVIIDRMENFDVFQPLMTFVTGLELLLKEMQEWEKNAANYVSLMTSLEEISLVLIRWRKIELNCWLSTLEVCSWRVRQRVSQLWFHLHSIFLVPGNHDNSESEQEDLAESLVTFLESCSIGEYEPRLDLLDTLRGCLRHADIPEKERSWRMQLLVNTIDYYRQFLEGVLNELTLSKKPIEKKMKDFIKIVRWGDYGFWSVRATVEKCHKALYKQRRSWEAILNQPVQSHLGLNKETAGNTSSADVNGESSINDIGRWKKIIGQRRELPQPIELLPDLVSKLPSLTTKFHHFANQVGSDLPLPFWTRQLDEFTSDWLEALRQLRAATPENQSENATAEQKASWKRAVTTVQQRKRKALSDFFKDLTSMGLSYRRGLVHRHDNMVRVLVESPSLEQGHCKDDVMVTVRRRQLRCVARRAQLTVAYTKPATDLGVDNIDRCVGFVDDLFTVCDKLQRHLSNISPVLSRLDGLTSQLETSCQDFKHLIAGNMNDMKNWMESSKLQCEEAVDQWLVFWQLTSQNQSGGDDKELDAPWPKELLPEGLITPSQMTSRYSQSLQSVSLKLNVNLDKNRVLKSSQDVELEKTFVQNLEDFSQLSKSIANEYRITLPNVEEEVQLPLTDSLIQSASQICEMSNTYSNLATQSQPSSSMTTDAASETVIDELIRQLLLTMQTLINHVTSVQSETGDADNEDTSALIGGKLQLTILNVNIVSDLNKISELCQCLMQTLVNISSSGESLRRSAQLIGCAVQLLRTYVSLSGWLLSNSAACLASLYRLLGDMEVVMTDIIEHGFCLPTEAEDNGATTQGEQFKDIESGGLGAGEGCTDVSEQIENEDQLDDTMQKDQEKKKDDDDKDNQLQDEEHGVEMSEDFDGGLHDAEHQEDKKEDDDEEEENKEDDSAIDDQMGEVGEQPDRELDEEMWAGDDNDEEEEEGEKAEEEDAGGVRDKGKEERKTVAKEDNEGRETADPGQEEGRDKEEEDEEDKKREEDDQGDKENKKKPEDKREVEGKQPPPDSEDVEMESLNGDDKENSDDVENEDKKEEESMEIDDLPDQNLEENEIPDNTPKSPEDEQEGNEMGDPESEGIEPMEQNEADNTEVPEETEATVPDTTPTTDDPTDLTADQPENDTLNQSQAGSTAQPSNDCSSRGDQHAIDQSEGSGAAGGMKESSGADGDKDTSIAPARLEADDNVAMDTATRQQRNDESSRRNLADPDSKDYKKNREILEAPDAPRPDGPEEARGKESSVYEHTDPGGQTDSEVQGAAGANNEDQFPLTESSGEDKPAQQKKTDTRRPREEEKIDEEVEAGGQRKCPLESDPSPQEDIDEEEKRRNQMETEGDSVTTQGAQRGPKSAFYTQPLLTTTVPVEPLLSSLWPNLEPQQPLQHPPLTPERLKLGRNLWSSCLARTDQLSRDLAAQLRLVLEPSEARRLRGDYRTGKRLNMRKVIPFVASHFRKDKIWLRRTRPSHRKYQVLLAVDDSSSMRDNLCRQMTFEALSIVSTALTMLEAGQLGICSFGEDVRQLHSLSEPFTSEAGAQVVSSFEFSQNKTNLVNLLQSSLSLMAANRQSGSTETSQLLLIVSDGVFSEDPLSPRLQAAVRRAREHKLFTVCIILDNPGKKHSVFDMKKYLGPGKFAPYMDLFPLPYYLVLRDIQSLPAVLADALRQWFELVNAPV